nr:mediator of RNA polymerase II transcription subunit 14-like [Ipomoea trifida]
MAAALTFLQAAEESYVSLKELVEKSRSSDLPDFDKKRGIFQYLVKTQQRMLRLNVIAKWFQQVGYTYNRSGNRAFRGSKMPNPG